MTNNKKIASSLFLLALCVTIFSYTLKADEQNLLNDSQVISFVEDNSSDEILSSTEAARDKNEILPIEKIKTLSGYELQGNEILTQSQVQKGDTIGTILNKFISYNQLIDLIKLTKPLHKLTNIQVNKKYQLVQDSNGNFLRFEYQKNSEDVFVLSVKDIQNLVNNTAKTEDIFDFQLAVIDYEKKVEAIEFEIEASLSKAISKAGERRGLASAIEGILSYNLDFSNALKKGDIFKVLLEKKYDEEKFINYGNILAVSFERGGENFSVYRFEDDVNQGLYYNANGDSLQSSFLEVPLNYTRISSPYTLARKHPILGITRPHQGIDYAAPSGTPVYAASDAIVEFVGTKGDFGKTVILKHANGIETLYAHLSRYDAKTKKSAKINKGDIIAYVGSTGLSTGPHLDFRVMIDGEYVNPQILATMQAEPLDDTLKDEFLLVVNEYNIALEQL